VKINPPFNACSVVNVMPKIVNEKAPATTVASNSKLISSPLTPVARAYIVFPANVTPPVNF